VDDDKRGRVMSIFATAFSGTMPLGNLMVGASAGQIGATFTLIGSGAICIVIVAIFYRNLPGLRAAAAPALAKHELLLGEPALYPIRED
jgi:hypothetical protein